MDIMTGLAAVNAALEAVKTIRNIDKDFDAARLRMAIADLTSNMADAKIALVEARDEKTELLEQIKQLKSNWSFGENLVERAGYKYFPSDDGEPTGDPFCVVCERNEGKYFQVTPSKGMVEHKCPNCKSVFHHLPTFMSREYLRAEKKRLGAENKE